MADLSTYGERAIDAYQAMQRYFADSHDELYQDRDPGPGGYSYLWPFSQALAATIDVASLPVVGRRYFPDVGLRLAGLEHYWNRRSRPPGYDSGVRGRLGGGGDQYYDDNGWVGLELLRAHELTRQVDPLHRAGLVFTFIASGWDTSPSRPAPGGVFWAKTLWCRDRNTASTAPGALLALRLYDYTGLEEYITWAERMYDWVRSTLLSPEGLYWDHIDLSGQIERTFWSYNQGVMIGAGVRLAQATGDATYLAQAEQTAAAAMNFYGEGDRLDAQGAGFNAIFFKNLLLLDRVSPNPAYRELMAEYAERVWQTWRHPTRGLFQFEPGRPPELLHQAAMVQIYATLAGAGEGLD